VRDMLLAPLCGGASDGASDDHADCVSGVYDGGTEGHEAFKQRQYDRLADHVRRHVDMARLYEIISRP